MNALADADPETMRISIDTKATVHVGEYSRGGRSRGVVAVEALDHDMSPKEKLVPGGILEPVTGRSFLFFGTHYKTSDFMVDGIFTMVGGEKAGAFQPETAGHQFGQRAGMQRTPQPIPTADDGICRYDRALHKACLLPSLSQQIQRH